MGSIFDGIEVIPIDQIVGDSVKSLRGSRGRGSKSNSQDEVVERLDKLIILIGRLVFQPDNIQIPPKVYTINLGQTVKDAPLGMTRVANSITFLKPDADFTVKLGILINGNESIMTESKKIPLGRDTVINGILVQEIYYTLTAVTGANHVEVFAAWI